MRPAEYAWIALVAGIAAWELAAPKDELLSHAVDRQLIRHPIATRAAVIITAAHLLNLLERKPLSWLDVYEHLARIGIKK